MLRYVKIRRPDLRRYILSLAVILGMFSGAVSAEIQDFAWCARLAGNGYNVPVRVAIPAEVIAGTQAAFADLRIFNDLGEEVAYAICTQPGGSPVVVRWEVVETCAADGIQTFKLKRKHTEGFVHDLEIHTGEGFFYKDVTLFSSVDGQSWEYLTKDSIIDMRPHVEVYDTTVELPETRAAYIRIEMTDARKKERDPSLRIFLEQAGIDRYQKNIREIRVQSASSRMSTEGPTPPVYDQALFTQPETYLDEEGSTVIDLGKVGLPLEEVSLEIFNPYFYREVELWTSRAKDSSSFSPAGRGCIYGIEAYALKNTALSFGKDKCSYVRLKVVDNGRTPLSINRVALQWTRRGLSFIPLKGRRYTLYFGAKDVKAPKYAIQDMIRDNQHVPAAYGSWQMRRAEKNETYNPDRLMKKRFKLIFLLGFGLLVVYILGFWIIQFRNYLPKAGHR